jgi:hypothetical protein
MLSAASTIGLMMYISHHGGFDATAIWISRARFFYLGDRPMELLPDLVAPDYPLLYPSVVARGWQYSKRDTIAIPLALASFFTAGSIVLVCGLRLITASNVTLLAGCVLAGTPFFLLHGLSQFADIVMCFFITSAVALFVIDDFTSSQQSQLPILAGMFAGFAACTKNEGTLYVVALILSRLCLLVWDRHWKTEARRIGLFVIGLLPGILTLAVFRKVAPVPGALFANMTVETIRNRIPDISRHSVILSEYWKDLRHWGEWWINPLLLLILFVVIRRILKSTPPMTRAWRFPAFLVAIMLCGFYLVYLFSPYDALWHLQTSFNRLLLQLWPAALLAWALLVTPSRTG